VTEQDADLLWSVKSAAVGGGDEGLGEDRFFHLRDVHGPGTGVFPPPHALNLFVPLKVSET
jgi:hypothetical protein